MFTPKGPVAGSFQQTLWPRGRASEAAILVSRAFAFVFSWYKAIIALSLCFSSGALQHTVHTSIIAAKIISLNFFFELQYFGPDLMLAPTKTAIPIRSVQNADCRLQTAHRVQNADLVQMQTADWVQNADSEFILFFRLISDDMSSYNLPSVTQLLFRYHLSRLFAGVTTSRARSRGRRNDRNRSGQRGNNFNTSYRDISVVVAENNSVWKAKMLTVNFAK